MIRTESTCQELLADVFLLVYSLLLLENMEVPPPPNSRTLAMPRCKGIIDN